MTSPSSFNTNIYFDTDLYKSRFFQGKHSSSKESESASGSYESYERSSASGDDTPKLKRANSDTTPLLNRLTITSTTDEKSHVKSTRTNIEHATYGKIQNLVANFDSLSIDPYSIKNGCFYYSDSTTMIIEKENKKFIINKTQKLGTGGLKTAYLGYSEQSYLVVYTELKTKKLTQRKQEDFNNEARFLKIFKNNAGEGVIVQYISAIKDPLNLNVIALIQDYCPLGDLFEFYEDGKFNALTDKEKFGIFENCAHALKVIKKMGIHHRDIKAENFFLRRLQDGVVTAQLGDFGYATTLEEEIDNPRCVGSIRYYAPEYYRTFTDYQDQIKNKEKIDPAILSANIANFSTDMFALGVMLYKMRNNGDLPAYTSGENEEIVENNIYNLNQHSIDELFPSAHKNLLELINKSMMSIDPTQRPNPEELTSTIRVLKNINRWQ